MSIFDSKTSLTDTLQGGMIDLFSRQSITKKSYQYTPSFQTTNNTQTTNDLTKTNNITYQPTYIINSAGASSTPTTTPSVTKKTDVSSSQTPTTRQIPQTIMGSIQPIPSGSSNDFMSNINDIATIGVIGVIAYVGYEFYKKKKSGKK